MDMGRREKRVRHMGRVTWKLTLPYVKQIESRNCCRSQGTQTGALYQPRGVGLEGDGREVEKGGEIRIPMANSC